MTQIAEIDVSNAITGIGNNPSAVAWNGTDLYVAGFNGLGTTQQVAINVLPAALSVGPVWGVPFGVQYERVTALAKGYNDALVMAEANAQQDAHIEELAKRGVRVMPFTTTNATKAYAVERLAGSMERGDVQFQDDEGGMLEMEAMESSRTPSGLVKFAAPEGLHDDVPMARMIAYSGIAESGSLFPWE